MFGIVSAEPIVELCAITTFSLEIVISTPADSALLLTKDIVGTSKSIIRFFLSFLPHQLIPPHRYQFQILLLLEIVPQYPLVWISKKIIGGSIYFAFNGNYIHIPSIF